jgi:hypothetical protein
LKARREQRALHAAGAMIRVGGSAEARSQQLIAKERGLAAND